MSKQLTAKLVALMLAALTAAGGFGIDQAEMERRRSLMYTDPDSLTPLCTNQYGRGCCHWLNIGGTLKWQRDELKAGLAEYPDGDPAKMMKVVFYLSAYARKLERNGDGFEAAKNAYCAFQWQKRCAERGCDEALAACACCLESGGALGRHCAHLWSGPPSCYSQDLHDVPVSVMAGFEPAPEYRARSGLLWWRTRYVRAYDQDKKAAAEYRRKVVELNKQRWHDLYTSTVKSAGWRQGSSKIEIVRPDFSRVDVRAHVENLIKEMDADLKVAHQRRLEEIEMDKREEEAKMQELERLRQLEKK